MAVLDCMKALIAKLYLAAKQIFFQGRESRAKEFEVALMTVHFLEMSSKRCSVFGCKFSSGDFENFTCLAEYENSFRRKTNGSI